MNKKKKIVFTGFLFGFGGAEKSMLMVANGLARLGNEVTIISLEGNNIVYDLEERVNIFFLPTFKGNKIKKIFNRFKKLKRILKQLQPDVVISFWLQPAIIAEIISRFNGYKTVYSERGDPSSKEYKGIYYFVRKCLFNCIDGFVFQTEGAKNYFSKSIQNKSVVINNPVFINYKDYPRPETRNKEIVNVGRLHEQKNQALLIRSFSQISDFFPEYILKIYGEGDLKPSLENLIEELNLKEKVLLEGTINKLFKDISASSLFVLTSDYEGMPNALMEAMALGIPSISTDCKPGGARELINHNVNGFIIKTGAENQLAQSMKYLLDHPIEAEKLGKEAQKICDIYDPDKILLLWENYILRIIQKGY